MNDRRSHFLTMTGDVCAAAGLANLDVEILLASGATTSGVPSSISGTNTELDQTGYSNRLFVNGEPVALDDVVGFIVRTP